MSKISKKLTSKNCKNIGEHQKYLSRITKTLYYGKLPKNDSLSIPVTELAAELFSEAQKGKSLERLHYNDAAKISRNACVSPCSLVLAMLYLERLKKCNPEYLLKTAPSDLFLVSLMVSCKFLFDDGESDEVFVDEWAASGGITIKELIQLEKNFLKAIDWEIYVNELTFWKKLTDLETTLSKKQGCSRGFFTYTELQNLATTLELHNLINCFVTVSVILAATYTAGLLTIVGSMFLASQIPGTCLQQKKIDQHNQSIPILYEESTEFINDAPNILEEEEIKTDSNSKVNSTPKSLDAVNVLKTGILLASIKSAQSVCNYSEFDTTFVDDNAQYVSWDWWNVPVMSWLAKTSDFVNNLEILTALDLGQFYYFEGTVGLAKQTELRDQINKATKTRIQDQMEMSWHKEWTDTIKYGLFYNRILPYNYHIHNIKS